MVVAEDGLTGGGLPGGLSNQNNLPDNQVKCSSHVNSLFSPSSSTLQWEQSCNYSGKIEFISQQISEDSLD